ncbi:MAG: hypothetical protein DYG89_50220 [Caldilinea sp. CFX5]|nr:hypothetical protein [Caldilinea sp. CFX5]
MQPENFLRTIYLGDRACKSILIDGWNGRVVIQIDKISRIRSTSGNWEFYVDEDIDDGFLVFSDVKTLRIDPPGLIPNDLINSLDVKPLDISRSDIEPLYYTFVCSIDSVDNTGNHAEVFVEIVAANIYLEDPKHPGQLIKD